MMLTRERIFQLASVAFAILGAALAVYGLQEKISWLTAIGFAICGIGAIAIGIEVIVAQRLELHENDTDSSVTSTYLGLNAVIYGVIFILTGLAMLVASPLFLFGWAEPFGAYVTKHVGTVIILGGVIAIVFGVSTFAISEEESASRLMRLLLVPRRFFGIFLLLFGVASIALGGFELMAPATFKGIWDGIFHSLFPYYQ
jgi:hypothetical protein